MKRLYSLLVFISKFVRFLISPQKAILVLNYHRIIKKDVTGPYSLYHNVLQKVFIKQLHFLSFFGRFIHVIDKDNYDKLGKINFIITFDDVSKSILNVYDYLISKNIPFLIAPATELTNKGFGIRDKVYYICYYLASSDIKDFLMNNIDENIVEEDDKFSFYKFSKSNYIHPEIMKKEVIDPLFSQLDLKSEDISRKEYLSWDELKYLLKANSNITIANHSHNHYNYDFLSFEEMLKDIEKSNGFFKINIGEQPKHLVLPFGTRNNQMEKNIYRILHSKIFESCFFMDNKINFVVRKIELNFISRVNTPINMRKFLWTIIIAFNGSFKKI